MKKGVRFRSETDTETIAQLIASYYEGDLILAVQKALEQLRGFWLLPLFTKTTPILLSQQPKKIP